MSSSCSNLLADRRLGLGNPAASGKASSPTAEVARRDDRGRGVVGWWPDRGSALAVPGASAYFLGGAVIYTKQARLAA
jgi:hypothetical protein